MIRLVLTAVGADIADAVRLDHDADPVPGPGELLVAIEAAPVNPGDFLLAAGLYAFQPRLPFALGTEGVGRVLAVGTDTGEEMVGRRVLILPTYEQGTWADKVLVPAHNAVLVGDEADPLQLAMLVNAASAHVLLTGYVDLKPGDWIGLTLANSAVGQNVIALAKHAGLHTLAVVRRESAVPPLRARGADLVLIDGEDLGARGIAELGGNRLRLLLDGIGGTRTGALVGAVENGGTVVAFSAVTGESPVLPLGDLIFRGISLHGLFIIDWVRGTSRAEVKRVYGELGRLVERGVLSTAVEATYSLAQYRDALADAARTGRNGKILLTPGQQGS